MELIKVNTAKLKIILTPSDIKEFDIDARTFDYTSKHSQKAFRSILTKAKELTGFDASGCRLYVNFFPSRDGGAEMYLTRKAKILPDSTCLSLQRSKNKESVNESTGYILQSFNLDTLILLCSKLHIEGHALQSSLYFMDGKYYLHISALYDGCGCDIPQYICEYGKVFYADKTRLCVLSEHSQPICKQNAVDKIARNFLTNLK